MCETWGYAPGEFRNGRNVRSNGHGEGLEGRVVPVGTAKVIDR